MRRALVLVGLALTVALAATAAGCGGGGGGGAGGGKRLTRSEFVSKADAICGDANKKVPEPPSDIIGFDPTAGKGTDKQLESFGGYLDKLVKVFRDEVDDLRGLKPPQNVQDDYDRALSILDEALNELDEAAQAAHNHDREKLKDKLEESDKHSTEANQIAKRLGLRVCGS